MNIIGFLKNHDLETRCSQDIILSAKNINPDNELDLVISYLKKWSILIACTLWLTDIDGEDIGEYIIYTDGEWIWPSYYSFYLRKYNSIKIPDEFINYIKRGGKEGALTSAEKGYAEYFLIDLLKIKVTRNWIPPEEVQAIVEERGREIKCY